MELMDEKPSLSGRNFRHIFLSADMAVPDFSEFNFSCGVVQNLATYVILARKMILQHVELELTKLFFVYRFR